MTRSRHTSGFTLLELLTVIVLMGVATTMGVMMLFKVSDAWRDTARRIELDEMANRILDELRQDFGAVVSPSVDGASIRGVTRTANDARFFKIPLEDDRVTLPASLPMKPDGPPERVDISYQVNRQDGQTALLRTVNTPGAAGAPAKVADGVLALRFEYVEHGSDGAWHVGWSKPALPAAVRVSPYEQISRDTVFPIRVD
ncbi:MAG: type II secretion system protein [Candidatus Hydrogenedentes bacterium]|nr:type II secretion system protein [Candidatus Hydrogenedentota bacterium]